MEGGVTLARDTQTNGEFASLERATEELQKLISVLENRISPILRVSDDVRQDKDTPEPMVVPLADRVRSIRKVTESSIRKVAQILERVEL